MEGQSPARFLLIAAVAVSPWGCTKRRAPLLVPPSETFAELRAVRAGVSVIPPREGPRAPYDRERLTDGEQIAIQAGGLAWLRRDGGATLLAAGPSALTLRAAGIEVAEGKVFVDTTASAAADVLTPRGAFRLAKVRASLEVRPGGAVEIYVLNGSVHGEGGVHAGPGEMLTIGLGGAPAKAAAVAWEDWTGGLATTDPAAEPAPFGVGTIGARRAGDQGAPRFALTIQRLDVHVTVDHDFATTEVDEVFFNPTSNTVEGMYSFRTPQGASLSRFGVDRQHNLVWGRIQEKQAARAQYQAHVYQGSTEDPALLEWDAPGVYKARLYPIEAGATRRVVTRYSEWLGRQGERSERRLYVYPMAAEGAEGSLPRIEELTISLDLGRAGAREARVGMQGERVGDHVTVKAFDYVPRADFAVELLDAGTSGVVAYRSPHRIDPELLTPEVLARAAAGAAQEPDYLLVPLHARRAVAPTDGLDLAVVVDTSAATDRGALALARAMTGALLAHLGPNDRAAVWAGDATLRPVATGSDTFARMDGARREAIATGLSRIDRGGATDLGTMVADAATKIDATRRSALVYIGDGRPTVGELALPALRERLSRLPRQVRVFAVGVGDEADLGVLKGLASGGLVERVTDGFGAARTALRLLEEAERPVWIGAEIDLGPGIERVFPRELGVLPADQTVLAVGRVKGEVPKQLVVRSVAGEVSERMSVVSLEDGGDLRRRWAEHRLTQLLEEGASRAAVAEIGVRSGILTPFTSFYVPTQAEYQAERERRSADSNVSPDRDHGRLFGLLGRGAGLLRYESMAPAPIAMRAKGAPGSAARADHETDGAPAAMDKELAQAKPAEAPPEFAAVGAGLAAAAAAPRPALPVSKARAAAPRDAPRAQAAEHAALSAAPPAPPAPPAPAEERAGAAAPAAPAAAHAGLHAASSDEITALAGGVGRRAAGAGPTKPNRVAPVREADALGGSARQDAPLAPMVGLTGASGEGKGLAGASNRKAQATPGAVQFEAHVEGTLKIIGIVPHERQVCSAAANHPLEERRALWRERLAGVRGVVPKVLGVYDQALAGCEAPTWRERQSLLLLMVDAAGTIANQVALWRALVVHPEAANIVYRAMVTRVRSAAELRELSDALGLKKLDPSLLATALSGAMTPEARLVALKELTTAWPDNLELALKLLEAYEDTGDPGGGRALARQLRARVDANTRVRTEVGEYYLRLAAASGSGSGSGSGGAQVMPAQERDLAEARRTFGEIVEFSPEDPVARRRLGNLLCAHGWYDEAFRQYQTLAQLSPEDSSVFVLLGQAAQGTGKTEEAIRWIEKSGLSGSPDGMSASARAARSLASAFLAWARQDAVRAGRSDEASRLSERARRLAALDAIPAGTAKVILTWSHPELHVQLWASALGAPLPAPDGDPLLGVAQAMIPAQPGATVELRLDEEDEAVARRLGLSAVLTTIVNEGATDERIGRTVVSFAAPAAASATAAAAGVKPPPHAGTPAKKRAGRGLEIGGGGPGAGGAGSGAARRFHFEGHTLVEEAV